MLAAIAGATGSAWCFQTPGASGNPGDGDYDLMDLDCATSPMPSADVAAAVAAVKQINEEAGGQLEEDLLLGKIQLVVEVGALGKFTGSCLTRPGSETGTHNEVEHYRATVPLQFHNIFAGEGMRCRKVDSDSTVERLAL